MPRFLIRFLLVIVFVLDACGPATPGPTDSVTPSALATLAATPTVTAAVTATAQPVLPTATAPQPTPLPVTPTPLSVVVLARPTPIPAPTCLASAPAPVAGGEKVLGLAVASDGHMLISSYTQSISRTNIYVSDDAGSTWALVRTLNDYISNVVPSPSYARDRLVYAVGSGGIYRSFNGGVSWATITPSGWFTLTPTIRQLGLSPDFANDRTIILGSRFAPRGVFASNDGGSTWTDWLVDAVDAMLFSPNYAIDRTVWVARNDERTFRRDVLVTSNQGDQWDFVRSGTAVPLAISPAYAQDSTIIWTSLSGGLFLSRNSDRVFPLIEKADADVLHIWQNMPGSGWVVTGEQFVRDLAFSPDFANDRTAYAVTDQAVILTHDGGVSWQPLCYGAQDASFAGPARFTRIAISPDFLGDHTLYLGGAGATLLVSHDSGQTWTGVGLRQ